MSDDGLEPITQFSYSVCPRFWNSYNTGCTCHKTNVDPHGCWWWETYKEESVSE